MNGTTPEQAPRPEGEHGDDNRVDKEQQEDDEQVTTADDQEVRQKQQQPQQERKESLGGTCSTEWTRWIRQLHTNLLDYCLHKLAHIATHAPKTTILTIFLFSITIFIIGLVTNFSLDVNESTLWTPRHSYAEQHRDWINLHSGFPPEPRIFFMVFHKFGQESQPSVEDVRRIFTALDTLRNVSGYHDICPTERSCDTFSITDYWNHNSTLFEESLQTTSLETQLSSQTYYDGTPVLDDIILGYPQRSSSNGTLTSVMSYFLGVNLPPLDHVAEFEKRALAVMTDLQSQMNADQSALQLQFLAERSFADEFERAVIKDVPLVPAVFVVMSVFTSLIFWKSDPVQSRSLLGVMAVVAVLLSIVAGYGIMFCTGLKFTSMTQILPFVLMGVGLDDAFIITGSFLRLHPSIDIKEKIRLTVNDVGVSIFMTSLTSSVAFALGGMSSVPAIYRLCFYAALTIALIFIYQMTFFMACLVLDERRVQAKRGDMLRCRSKPTADLEQSPSDDAPLKDSMIDRIMVWYAEKLLQPCIKVAVIVAFLALTVGCGVSASRLEQAFRFTDVLPDDSYAAETFYALDDYSRRSAVRPAIVFRDVDQSDPAIQDQMLAFINDLVTNTTQIEDPPALCWISDLRKTLDLHNRTLTSEEFNANVAAFLEHPVYSLLYKEDVILDEDGAISASRCFVNMDNIDLLEVTEQVNALEDQRAISLAQPVNKGQENRLRFFTYEEAYQIWEFYAATPGELRDSTIASIAAVCVIVLCLVPHWSAILFALPIMCVLYVDLMGILQLAGVPLNPVSYVGLVMSIGLLIDFVLHVLLRYYESPGTRVEKTTIMLKTMGSSILIGGITTFLGTIPLAFSTSEIFFTIFVAFLALVCLGAAHGLILLPVLLSMFGPTVNLSRLDRCEKDKAGSAVEDKKKEPTPPNNSGEQEDDVFFPMRVEL